MSISPANPDTSACGPTPSNDSTGETVMPSSGRGSRSKDEITIVHAPACPPVPGFLSADARPPAGDAQSAETPTLETEVRKLQAALNTAAGNRPANRRGRRDKLAAGVVRGSTVPGRPTILRSRRGLRAFVGMTLAAISLAAAGAYVFVILPQMDEWDVAELPPAPERAAPPALPSGAEAGGAANEATRQPEPSQAPPAAAGPTGSSPPPVTPPPTAPAPESRPVEPSKEVAGLPVPDDSHAAPAPASVPEPSAMTAREPPGPLPESEPTGTPMEVAALLMDDDSRAASPPPALPERSTMTSQEPPATRGPPAPASATPAASDAPVVTAPELVPPASPEPPAESRSADRAPQGAGTAAAPQGVEAANPGARYPAASEQKVSVDRLRMARAELFVRQGFRDDMLRVSSGAAERVAITDPHRQYLTTAQLRRLSPDQLDLVRYEIFARRGRFFNDPVLRAYFEQFAWYRPYAWEVTLTRVEQANVDLIQSYQQTMLAPGPAARPWRAPPS